MEHQTFKVYVHGPVHQFYRILHQSLVLGMAHAGRNHGAAVMLGKGLEVGIYHRFVAVAASDCGFQVVRYNRTRRPSIKVESILARLYKILLLLRPRPHNKCNDSMAVSPQTPRPFVPRQ